MKPVGTKSGSHASKSSEAEVGFLKRGALLRTLAAGLTAVLAVTLAAPVSARVFFRGEFGTKAAVPAPMVAPVVGAAAAASGEAEVTAGDLELRVRAGWNGAGRQGAVPVVAEITNRGGDTDLELEVLLRQDMGFNPQGRSIKGPVQAVYVRRVILARGEKKQVLQFVPLPGPMQLEVRLVREGMTLASVAPRIAFTGDLFVGILSDRPETFTFKRLGTELKFPVPVRTITLTRETLPGSVFDLATFDAIIVDEWDTKTLAPEQRTALAAWVRRGGTLIVGVGSRGGQALEFLPPGLRPAEVTGVAAAASLEGLSRFGGTPEFTGPVPAAAFAEVRGAVLAAERPDGSGLPLLVESRAGDGRVILSAASLSREPLAAWEGKQALFVDLLGRGKMTPWGGWNAGTFIDRYNFLGWMTRTLPAAAFPSPRQLGFLLLAFIFLAGPVNYLVLRRLDRRDWAWVTVPVLSLGAVGLMYGLALGRDGRDVLVNTVSAIEIDPGAGVARQEAVIGVFSPMRARLGVEVPAGTGVRPMPMFFGGGPFPDLKFEDAPYRVVSAASDRIEFGPKTRWQSRILQISRDVEIRGGIRGALRVDGGVLRGRVTNETPYRIEDAGVVLGNQFTRLESLAPGESREVELPLPNPANLMQGGFSGWNFFNPAADAVRNPKDPAPPPPPLSAEKQLRANLLDNYFNGKNNMGGPSLQPLTFFGFTGDGAPDLPVPGAGRHRYALGLVVQPLRIAWAPGPFTLPRTLATGRFTDMQGAGGGSPWEMNLQNGSVVAELSLPLPAGARVERMILFLDANPMFDGPFGRPGEPLRKALTDRTLQIYNWRTGMWDPLPGQKEVRLDRPADYLSSGQVARLRVTADQGPILVRLPQVEASGFLPEGGAAAVAPGSTLPGAGVGVPGAIEKVIVN